MLVASIQRVAVYQVDVGPPVMVIIDDSDATAGGLDDVLLGIQIAVDVVHLQARLRGDIHEPRRLGMDGIRGIGSRRNG